MNISKKIAEVLVQNKFNIFIYVFINFLLSFEIYYFLIHTHTIYIWDNLLYHISTSNLIDILKQGNIKQFFHHVQTSLKYSDYNVASQLLLIPFNFFDQNNRFLFILSMSIVYIAPTLFVIYLFVKNILKIDNKFLLFLIIIYSSQFLPLILPAFLGLQDIACVLFFMISFYMYFQKPIEKRSYGELVLFGICLYMPFLFKKASLYGMVAFFIVFGFFSLYCSYKRGFNKGEFKSLFFKFTFMGIVILLMMLILQKGLLFRILFSREYFGYYADWQVNNIYSNFILRTLPNYSGLLVMLTSFLGLISIFKANQIHKHIFLLLLIWSVIFAVMFIQLQYIGYQHFQQIFGITFLLLSISFFIFLYTHLSNRHIVYFLIGFIIFIHYMTNALVVNKSIPNKSLYGNLLPSLVAFEHQNYNNIIKLLKFVNQEVVDSNLNIGIVGTAYKNSDIDGEALASYSFYFDNNQIVKKNLNYRLPVLDSSHLSIFVNIFKVSLIAVSDSFDAMPENQKIIEILNLAFSKNINIAKAFKLKNEFIFPNASYKIYQRTRLNTSKEIEDFFDMYLLYHPENRKEINEIIKRIAHK